MIIEGKTSSGFEFSIDDRKVSDIRFVRALSRLVNPKVDTTTQLEEAMQIVEFLLPEEDIDRLITHLEAKNDGFAPADEFYREIGEMRQCIVDSSKNAKN